MGLDMYLDKHYYVTELDESSPVSVMEINGKRIKTIVCQAMYWRKANQIHKWFVDNVQGGVDDCGSYDVTIEQLKELYKTVSLALKTKDHTVLEPQSGFFFGSTDIDEYYWRDLKRTKKELKAIIDEKDDGKNYTWFTYHASW
jgi:hypothetical protein